MAVTLPSWIVSLVVPYVLQALGGLGAAAAADLVAVGAEAKTALNTVLSANKFTALLIPTADGAVDKVVAIFQAVLSDTADLSKVVSDVVAGNYVQALADLEAMVVKAYEGGVSALMGDAVAHQVAAALAELRAHHAAAAA